MNQQELIGIQYLKTGERGRGRVCDYHGKPHPLKLNKTPHKIDVSGLKSKQRKDAVRLTDTFEYESKFTIGVEVEKNELHRGSVKEYELFCGFERDGSCGYEAVTHVLPLLPSGKWRNKVFDMIHKAERIIDDRYSPSDRTCGGHISIGVVGMSGDAVREAVRLNVGIVLSLFRHRLNTKYCGANRRLQSNNDETFNSWGNCGDYRSCRSHRKYQTALVKDEILEFRLPSKFESVKQTFRRYELFYEIVNFSINNPNGKHETLLKTLRPIVLSMYDGDVEQTDKIIGYAPLFREFILSGEIHPDIEKYLR